jgi:hypothetical protein
MMTKKYIEGTGFLAGSGGSSFKQGVGNVFSRVRDLDFTKSGYVIIHLLKSVILQ